MKTKYRDLSFELVSISHPAPKVSSNTVTFRPPVYSELCVLELQYHGRKFKLRTSDIDLLFHQERLKLLDPVTVSRFLESFRSNSSKDTSKFTDEQLFSAIKSRFVQHPTELKAWVEHLDEQTKLRIESLQSLVTSSQPSNAGNVVVHGEQGSPSSNANSNE